MRNVNLRFVLVRPGDEMQIEHIKIHNYKGFRDSGQIAIGRKFTVVVGQNNSGKTAFLETLDPKTFQNRPHITATAIKGAYPSIPNPTSSATFGIVASGEELKWHLLRTNSTPRFVFARRDHDHREKLVQDFFSNEGVHVAVTLHPGGNWYATQNPLHPLSYPPDHSVQVGATRDRQSLTVGPATGGVAEDISSTLIGPLITDSLYVFRAERLNVSECQIEGGIDLMPDARNLASVLLHLGSNPKPLEQFTGYLRSIFPTIFSVVSHPKPQAPTLAQIEVINRDTELSEWQPGVRIPLADCGTGISQVLAILYVVVTAATPKVIVIDEPNSFLHPGAAKKLLDILKERPHQYIITTHSPEIVRSIKPDVLHLTRWTGSESVIETLDGANVKDAGRLLQELGVRLSDVFGADNVLWVEGPTEEICFSMLLEAFGHTLSAGTAVVATVNPSDLTGKRPRRTLVWEIYERLTAGSVLIPPAIAFSFDREERTETEMQDIERRSRGLAHFLPRRTYENYVLDVEAISAVLRGNKIGASVENVRVWLEHHGLQRKYFDGANTSKVGDREWLNTVDAPRLLADMFAALSTDTPLTYDKLVHSVALTEWLIEHKRDALQELADYLATLINTGN